MWFRFSEIEKQLTSRFGISVVNLGEISTPVHIVHVFVQIENESNQIVI